MRRLILIFAALVLMGVYGCDYGTTPQDDQAVEQVTEERSSGL
jgi:hypothetical protein